MTDGCCQCSTNNSTGIGPRKFCTPSRGHAEYLSDFHLGEGNVGTGTSKGSTENFEMMFFGYLIKNGVTQRSLFWAIQFGARNITIKSKTTLFLGWNELGSLGLRGISPTL